MLSKLQPIPASDWARLRAAALQGTPGQALAGAGDAIDGGSDARAAPVGTSPAQAPRAFLLSVMNDPGVDMALRIEAARVLLAHG